MALNPDHARAWIDTIENTPQCAGDVVRDDPRHATHPDGDLAVCGGVGALRLAAMRGGAPLRLERVSLPGHDAALRFVSTDPDESHVEWVVERWLGVRADLVRVRLHALPLALARRIRERVLNGAARFGDDLFNGRTQVKYVTDQMNRVSGLAVWWLNDHGVSRRDLADALRCTLDIDADLVGGTPAYEALSAAQSAAEADPWGTGTPDPAQGASAPIGATT